MRAQGSSLVEDMDLNPILMHYWIYYIGQITFRCLKSSSNIFTNKILLTCKNWLKTWLMIWNIRCFSECKTCYQIKMQL